MLKQHLKGKNVVVKVNVLFTCPKKATLKYVPSSLLPLCITSITLVYARWRVSYRWVSFCRRIRGKIAEIFLSLLKAVACCRQKVFEQRRML